MASISTEILASYAADAAREVDGVQDLFESALQRHKGVRILGDEGKVHVELHLAVQWGVSIPALGLAVQERVAEYLGRMADVEPERIDVIVEDIRPA
jgi:uncharacterized alkaline shock family protein YloU